MPLSPHLKHYRRVVVVCGFGWLYSCLCICEGCVLVWVHLFIEARRKPGVSFLSLRRPWFFKTGLSLHLFLFVVLTGCRAPGTHLDPPPHCSSCGHRGLNLVSRLMQPVLGASIAIFLPQNLSKFLTMYVLRNVHSQSPCVNAPFRQNCRPVCRPMWCCQTLLLEKRVKAVSLPEWPTEIFSVNQLKRSHCYL